MNKGNQKFKQTEIGPIPEEWGVIKISDVTLIITKGTTPTTIGGNFSNNGIRFIKVENLSDDGRIVNDKMTYIDEQSNTLLKRSILQEHDILYTIAGTIGRVAVVRKNDLPANVNQAIAVVRPNLEEIDLEYLRYYLQSPYIRRNLASKTVQGVQANLSLSELGNSTLISPLRREQQKIAEILSSLDDKIELNRQMNATLEKIASTLFKKWFVDIGDELPKGWRISTIGEELEIFLGGTPSRAKDQYWTNGTIPWINSGKVNEFRITEASEYITKEALENSAAKLLPKGTVVIAITGATLGQYSLLEIDASFNQSVVGIQEDRNLKKEYIYFWIASTIKDLINSQTGGAQQHINKQVVDSHKILVPDQKILDNYYKISVPIFEIIGDNCLEVENLIQIRDSLLPRLMSGKIRV